MLEEMEALTSARPIAVDKNLWVNDKTPSGKPFAKSNIRLIFPHSAVSDLACVDVTIRVIYIFLYILYY